MNNDDQVNETTIDLVAESLPEADPVAEVKKSTKPVKVRTSFTLEPDLFDWVQEHAKAQKISVSAAIGNALASFRKHNV